ncbi:MAG: hypothetical protein ABFR62_06370 [Bacteroidota bacterium]
MKTILRYAVCMTFLSLFSSSCVYNVPVEEEFDPIEEEIYFSTDIQSIFNDQNCITCHNADNKSGDLDLSEGNSYSEITSKGLIDEIDPEESIIYYYPNYNGNHFEKYTAQQGNIILAWIKQGAKNN